MSASTTMGVVPNFLEEEDYENEDQQIETIAPKVEVEAEITNEEASESVEEVSESVTPIIPKERSGKFVTEGNAKLVAFAANFPGACSEAFSLLSYRQDLIERTGERVLPTVKGTETRLRKLEHLGVLAKYKHPLTQATHWSVTHAGICSAYSYGYNTDHATTLHKKSQSRASHYQMVALVAAQFASPDGFFRESLGVEPVGQENVISENEMRGKYEPIKEYLKQEGKNGNSADFGRWREDELNASLTEAANGRLDWSDIVQARPALLTVGYPQRKDTKLKAVHQPDLAVIRDDARTDAEALNLLVEVELTKKTWQEYTSILLTLDKELQHGFVYERAVYFTIGEQVGNLLRKVDQFHKLGLFESGRLVVLPLLDRNGQPITQKNRINLGASNV